jgi:hypothetical protein
MRIPGLLASGLVFVACGGQSLPPPTTTTTTPASDARPLEGYGAHHGAPEFASCRELAMKCHAHDKDTRSPGGRVPAGEHPATVIGPVYSAIVLRSLP